VTSKLQSVNATSANKTLRVDYAYGPGRQAGLTYPSGRLIAYGFNASGQVSSITVDGATILGAAEYLPFGAVKKWVWGNGQVYERSYDLDGRVDTLTTGPATGTYGDLSQVFGYDSLNRLISAQLAAGQSQAFVYDANGNRTSATVNGAATTYIYPTTSHRLTSLSGATTRSFTYDAAGNTTASAGVTYVYDGRGRMKQAGSTTYLVNGLGQRVKKSTAGADTYFAYDEAGHLIGEYDTSGAPVEETVWLGDMPVAVLKPAASGGGVDIFYIWTDHLGTPRLVTDAANNSRWEWTGSDPFGNNAPNENPAGLGIFAYNLRFPGQYFDQETGKHYNYFRDYDPTIGRYVESDPIGLRGGINTYGYVAARPLTSFDLFGLTEADVQGVFRDVLSHFSDINPAKPRICFRTLTAPNVGETDPISGQICVDPSWAAKECLTKTEYRELFFTLLHEGMHSTDPFPIRIFRDHSSIYRREIAEQGGSRPNGAMWGNPRSTPVDVNRMYDQYRKRTPACCGK
jgi:RHS repeat-associated protein